MLPVYFMTFEGVVHAGDLVSYKGQRGIVHSIGIRTTILRWFGEDTVIRNNDFKDFVYIPSNKTDRISATLRIDLRESLEKVEQILDAELPEIQQRLCEAAEAEIDGPHYNGVKEINENHYVLSFSADCPSNLKGWLTQQLNRELIMMCERSHIRLAMTQVVIHEAKED